jgi:hypothetical protein
MMHYADDAVVYVLCKPLDGEPGKSFNKAETIMKGLVTLALGMLMACSTQGQSETLPKPTGKYPVGVTYMVFTNDSRRELFDDSQQSYREITVKAWYPSDIKSDAEHYLLDAEAEFALKYLQFPALFMVDLSISI